MPDDHKPKRGIRVEFVEETRTLFREKFGVEMSPDEAVETIHNVTDYIRLLARWDKEAKKKQP